MAFAMTTKTAAVAPAARRATAAAPRAAVRANYRITMRAPEGTDLVFECGPDEKILEAAEAAGFSLPNMCRSGTCVGCAARRVEGELELAENDLLTPEQEAQGFALLCKSYPRSDLFILTHQEQEYYCASQFSSAPTTKTSSR